jgi:peroxiredoxin
MGKKPDPVEQGKPAPQLYLYNPAEKEYQKLPFPEEGFVSVICFLSYECPLSRSVLTEAKNFFLSLEKEPVQMIGVSSMPYENLERLRTFQKDLDIPFDLLYDAKGILAHQFQISRVPVFFVWDQEKVLRYCVDLAGMKEAVMGVLYNLDDFKTVTAVRGCAYPKPNRSYRVKKERGPIEPKPAKEHPHYMAQQAPKPHPPLGKFAQEM